jgi:hypothetical protein
LAEGCSFKRVDIKSVFCEAELVKKAVSGKDLIKNLGAEARLKPFWVKGSSFEKILIGIKCLRRGWGGSSGALSL